MKYSIESFSDGTVKLVDDNESILLVDKNAIPENAQISDIVVLKDGVFTLDTQETKDRKKEFEDILARLQNI